MLAALLPAQSCLTVWLWSDGVLVHRETKLVGEEDCRITAAATARYEEHVVLVLEHRPVGGDGLRTLVLEQPARPAGAELLLLLHEGRVPELPVALTSRYRRFETEGSVDLGHLALKVLLTPVTLCGDLLLASLWLWAITQDDHLDEDGWQRR
ncbi:MAG: hypothetical protein R3F30_04875 [Planctomycetota bacterium]